jgi:hypothetical protein
VSASSSPTSTWSSTTRTRNLVEHISPGARHEVFNETNADEVLAEVAGFVDRVTRWLGDYEQGHPLIVHAFGAAASPFAWKPKWTAPPGAR